RAASPAKFIHWSRQTDVVQDASAFRANLVNYTGGDAPEQLRVGQVSADFFRLFGARTIYGRTFTAEEDLPNVPKTVVLGNGLWVRRFGSDPAIVGRSITLGGEAFTVVGVLAPGFDVEGLGLDPELWIPFQIDPNTSDQGHYFGVAGPLKPSAPPPPPQPRLHLSTPA